MLKVMLTFTVIAILLAIFGIVNEGGRVELNQENLKSKYFNQSLIIFFFCQEAKSFITVSTIHYSIIS